MIIKAVVQINASLQRVWDVFADIQNSFPAHRAGSDARRPREKIGLGGLPSRLHALTIRLLEAIRQAAESSGA